MSKNLLLFLVFFLYYLSGCHRFSTYSEPASSESDSEVLSEMFHTAAVGDTITFGQYEQDADPSNGSEDIEWTVLDRQPDKLLLLSKYVLDAKLYNDVWAEVTWETCSIRNWLNTTFLDTAFSVNEQEWIFSSSMSNPENPRYHIAGGNPTQDSVFLLSYQEAYTYYDNDRNYKARNTIPTRYAYLQGCSCYSLTDIMRYSYANGDEYRDTDVSCFWWLRTPGCVSSCAVVIDGTGSIDYFGVSAAQEPIGIRPALWVKLN